jgi:hypothetical protein
MGDCLLEVRGVTKRFPGVVGIAAGGWHSLALKKAKKN